MADETTAQAPTAAEGAPATRAPAAVLYDLLALIVERRGNRPDEEALLKELAAAAPPKE